MHMFIHVLGRQLPMYGLMITLGGVIANIIALIILKKKQKDENDFIIMEAYGILGGFLGAKILYLLTDRTIDWSRIFEKEYFKLVMQGGFVFYGGLIGALIFLLIFSRVHKINLQNYLPDIVFLIPFVHGFGRIGCFMAGCCYGMPYDGPGSVIFPEGSFAPSGIPLFPIQLVEATLLFVISAIVCFLTYKVKIKSPLAAYLALYGVARFILEFFRYDELRGRMLALSTSQWISILMLIVAVVLFVRERRKPVSASS